MTGEKWTSAHIGFAPEGEDYETAYWRLMEGLNALPDGICIWDSDDRLVMCNESYRLLFGGLVENVQTGLTMTELARAIYRSGHVGCDGFTEDEWIQHRLDHHHNVRQYDEVQSSNNRCVRVTRAPLPSGHLIATRVDVTDLRDMQAELAEKARQLEATTHLLEQQAKRDPLTGLPNRRAWNENIAKVTARAAPAGWEIAVMCIDLDGFKQINDSFGHAVGDAVLVEVGQRLLACLPPDAIVARVGGDEFLIALAVETGSQTLSNLAQKMMFEVGKPIVHENTRCLFGLSVGATSHANAEVDIQTLLAEADSAVYQAKRRGRSSFCMFDDALRTVTQRKRRLTRDFLAAIENKDIIPFFQPKVCAATGTCLGYEALARWDHRDFGIVAPIEFIDLALSMKRMSALDRLILQQALEAQRQSFPDKMVSVNVSAARLRDPDLLKELAASKIKPGQLSLELIETAFLDHLDAQSQRNLDGLREMGIGIDLDDFGTGHASVAALLNIRPGRIKIDKGLVQEIDHKGENQELVRFIIMMAKSLDAKVVAEGVETCAQADILKSLGCDELQGYLFARPLPAREIFDADSAPVQRAMGD